MYSRSSKAAALLRLKFRFGDQGGNGSLLILKQPLLAQPFQDGVGGGAFPVQLRLPQLHQLAVVTGSFSQIRAANQALMVPSLRSSIFFSPFVKYFSQSSANRDQLAKPPPVRAAALLIPSFFFRLTFS